MSDYIIKVENLGKKYKIRHQQERQKYVTLRDVIANKAAAPLRWLRNQRSAVGSQTSASQNGNSNGQMRGRSNGFALSETPGLNGSSQAELPNPNSQIHDPFTPQASPLTPSFEDFWALKDVSFEIKQGEILGIIGSNGAGKTTLLKILSRITKPTEGQVHMRGRVASLLEVGTGFHPELTGRENIFLNGAILGMTRAEIQKKFDEIVAFAEVEKFLDTPVKRYSSGMYVRLAFGVAAHLEPEILIVDEVLAVGDAAFQKKCLGKMGEVAKTGRTVLFVTHNMGSVQGLCERIIWLEKGRVELDGEPAQTVQNYLDRVSAIEDVSGILTPLSDLRIERVLLKNISGEITNNFRTGESLVVEIHYSADKPVEQPYFWMGIESQSGYHLTANMLLDGFRPRLLQGKGIITCRFKYLPLLPRRYTVHMGVRDKTGNILLVKSGDVAGFNIVSNVRDIGFTGERADSDVWDAAPVLVPYEWRLPDGQILGIDPLSEIRKVEETKEVKRWIGQTAMF